MTRKEYISAALVLALMLIVGYAAVWVAYSLIK